MATPEQFPRLKAYGSELDYEGKVAASCIHCHQVGESLHAVLRDDGKANSRPKCYSRIRIQRFSASSWIRTSAQPSFALKPIHRRRRDGFRAGDKIISLQGQSILSTADIQWVLHNAADEDELPVSIERGGQPMQLALSLPPGWRTRGDISWRATSWALRRMTTGGMQLEDLSHEQRAERQIDDDALALAAKHVGEYGEHAHAKKQGFVKGDVIVSIAGESNRMRESDLFALLVNRPVGESIPVSVLRGSKQIQLSLTMQK